MELPRSTAFCVSNGSDSIETETDSLGRRIIAGSHTTSPLDVFGDSQVLGFDGSETHHLSRHFSNRSLNIAAAPNNGPFESLAAINLYKQRLGDHIVIGFNMSTDVFRLRSTWRPDTKSPFKLSQLNYVAKSSTIMQGILLWESLVGESVEKASVGNADSLHLLFKDYISNQPWQADIDRYFAEMEQSIALMPMVAVSIVFYTPYWWQKTQTGLGPVDTYMQYFKTKAKHSSVTDMWIAEPTSYDDSSLTPDRRHWRQDLLTFRQVILN